MLQLIAPIAASIFGGLFGVAKTKAKIYGKVADTAGSVINTGIQGATDMKISGDKVTVEEIRSDGFFVRNWRPFSMLSFVTTVMLHCYGVINLSEANFGHIVDLTMAFGGVYGLSRTVEKIAGSAGVRGLLKGVIAGAFGRNALKGME